MLDDVRVVDRDVGRATFKIAHGVATLEHQLTNQLIRLGDDPLGVIDEAALQGFPSLTEPCGVSGRQRRNGELLNALFASLEFRFPLSAPSKLTDSTVVFWTEPFLKSRGLVSPADEKPRRECKQRDEHNSGNNDPLNRDRIHIYVLPTISDVRCRCRTVPTD